MMDFKGKKYVVTGVVDLTEAKGAYLTIIIRIFRWILRMKMQ